jgi:ribulose-phosphate 3-epimerase
MIIVPAILTNNPSDLKQMIKQAEEFCSLVQIDIMDDEFVPSKSITSKDLEKMNFKIFSEIHLMVKHPQKYIDGLKKNGAKRIIFHFEADDDADETMEKIRRENLEVGLALNPETEISQIENFLEKIDLLLLLAVKPGFYGSPFIPEVLNKAKELNRISERNFTIALDGGVNLENILEIYEAGVENACVGSRIFAKGKPADNYKEFVKRIA